MPLAATDKMNRMKTKLFFLLAIINCMTGFSQVTVDWIERTIGNPDSIGYPYTLYPGFGESLTQLDPLGNVITTGGFGYSVNPWTAGPDSIYVAKYDNAGNMLWNSTYVGGQAVVNDMDIDTNGNIFIIGYTGDTAITIRVLNYDPLGNLLWSDSLQPLFFGSTSNFIRVLPDQSILSITTETVSSYEKVYLTRYDQLGNIINQHTVDSSSTASFNLADAWYTPDGRIILAGHDINTGEVRILKLNTLGQETNSFAINYPTATDVVGVTCDNSDMIYLTGHCYASGTLDIFVAKYDSSGTNSWFSSFDVANNVESTSDILLDYFGNVYVCGFIYDAITYQDICILKYLPDGQLNWYKQIDTTGNDDFGYQLDIDNYGNLYLLGREHILNESSVVIKFDPWANIHWVEVYNYDGGNDEGTDFVLDDSANVYLTGYSYSSAIGNFNQFAIKYGQSGEWGLQTSTYFSENNLAVYPNPTNSFINLSSNRIIESVAIYDMNGKQCFVQNINNCYAMLKLDLSDGLYIVHIVSNGQTMTEKLIITK